MKRKVFLLCVILVSMSVSGQNHYVGLLGGLNISNISADNNFIENSKFRNGISCGLTYEFIFSKNLSIGADLLYIQHGYKSDLIFRDEMGNPIGENAVVKDFYDYVNLPIKFGYEIGNRIKVFAKIGINTAVLIKAKTIIPTLNDQLQVSGEEVINITGNVRKLDLGGIIGLGAGFKLNDKFEFVAVTGYRRSFTTFSGPEYFEGSNMKHYAINVSVGIKYKLNE